VSNVVPSTPGTLSSGSCELAQRFAGHEHAVDVRAVRDQTGQRTAAFDDHAGPALADQAGIADALQRVAQSFILPKQDRLSRGRRARPARLGELAARAVALQSCLEMFPAVGELARAKQCHRVVVPHLRVGRLQLDRAAKGR
jgi:hypothetical protein